MYQFDPILFHNPDQEFDIDDAEVKLFALMKSSHAIDGCKLVQQQVDKAITCNRKRSWTFICSHGKVMRNIDESHFGPDSVGKINVTYQNAKRSRLKGSIKGKFFFCVLMSICTRTHLFIEFIYVPFCMHVIHFYMNSMLV
jgi:hypothetical protein